MGLFRKSARAARPTDVLPAPVSTDTQAGAVALGRDSGPGRVALHNAFTDPDAGGRRELFPQIIDGGGVLDAIRIPESWYADRVLTGGVRTAPHFGEFIAEPGNTGGHTVITGRLPFVITDVEVQTEQPAGVTSFRNVPSPVADMCRTVPQVFAP